MQALPNRNTGAGCTSPRHPDTRQRLAGQTQTSIAEKILICAGLKAEDHRSIWINWPTSTSS